MDKDKKEPDHKDQAEWREHFAKYPLRSQRPHRLSNMLLFCPTCSNLLTISPVPVPLAVCTSAPDPAAASQGQNRLECRTCPYQYVITKRYYERKNYERKEREDVFGGPGVWDNAQKTQVQCPADGCDGMEAAFFQVQIRSADEPMTSFYNCMTCHSRWREN